MKVCQTILSQISHYDPRRLESKQAKLSVNKLLTVEYRSANNKFTPQKEITLCVKLYPRNFKLMSKTWGSWRKQLLEFLSKSGIEMDKEEKRLGTETWSRTFLHSKQLEINDLKEKRGSSENIITRLQIPQTVLIKHEEGKLIKIKIYMQGTIYGLNLKYTQIEFLEWFFIIKVSL